MQLTLSPVRMDDTLTAFVAGDVLTLNGTPLDFGPLPNGATLPRHAVDNFWIAGPVERAMDGTLTVPLILPHGGDAPEATRFPAPIDAADGLVPLPPYNAEKASPQVMASADGENWHSVPVEGAE